MCNYTTVWNIFCLEIAYFYSKTCHQGAWDNQSSGTWDTCIYLVRFVASKQPRPKPSWLQNLGRNAATCLPEKKSRMWTTWSDVWLTCGLTCSRASLTMQLTSGGSVYTPVFEPEEDSMSMHCDSRTILINAANYCYHLIVKIYRLTQYLF